MAVFAVDGPKDGTPTALGVGEGFAVGEGDAEFGVLAVEIVLEAV